MIGGQLRFLSKYFLSSQWEELVHGADIFAGFLGDRELVEQIEEHKNSKHTPVSEPVHKMITPVLIRRETTERDLLAEDN